MPSEDRARQALRALAAARQAFESVLSTTIDRVRALDRDAADGDAAAREAARLGEFAAGRIDAAAFAGAFDEQPVPTRTERRLVERALAVLKGAAVDGDAFYLAEVPPGGELHQVVAEALARAGRVFGAAHVVDLARAGRFAEERHGAWLERYAQRRWNRAERAVAPPLVVEVDGTDLIAAGLAEFLDGAQKIVLLVRGETAPPAPLARLVTPGVAVAQVADSAALAETLGFDGPAIAALVPESTVRFAYRPSSGAGWGALTVEHSPNTPRRRSIGSITPLQQAEELRQLGLLAKLARPSSNGSAPSEPPAETTQPPDLLASWLLRQSGLDEG